jgi:hypothetical protein
MQKRLGATHLVQGIGGEGEASELNSFEDFDRIKGRFFSKLVELNDGS